MDIQYMLNYGKSTFWGTISVGHRQTAFHYSGKDRELNSKAGVSKSSEMKHSFFNVRCIIVLQPKMRFASKKSAFALKWLR